MLPYQPPLREIRFLLEHVLPLAEWQQLPGCAELDSDTILTILDQAGAFCVGELLPLNLSGDGEGCRFDHGTVTTPKGFRTAYQRFAEGGWVGLACDPAQGGQGMPHLVEFAVQELICATNMAFGMYPGLSHGAYRALATHADADVQRWTLPKLADGSWSGTMCLTEPQCGTDLGLIRSHATPTADGRYRITGSKIFISAGEHDLTDNILHLVLARLPNAPAGIKGISLFLVPKFLPDGTRNGVTCTGIEHKMGIKASATCALSFEDATGWLVGPPHGGMRCMFTMMNAARLGVGIQGLGLAEAAAQAATAYADTRLQGRALDPRRSDWSQPADPIRVHADIDRMLLTQRATILAGRALAYGVGMQLDIAERHPDPARRQQAEDLVALLTPIIKAHLTDHGFEAANLAVQIHGGHGYIHEVGVEQLVRDARITQIYEGTNGVQSLDLVGRKLGLHTGRLLRSFFHPLADFLAQHPDQTALAQAFGQLQQATADLAARGQRDPEGVAAVANDYLKLFALVALGQCWAQMTLAAPADDRDLHATAQFFMTRILPEAGLRARLVRMPLAAPN